MSSFRNQSFVFFMGLVIRLGLAGLVTGCGGVDSLPPTEEGQVDLQVIDHDRYDGITPMRARVEGLGLSVAPAAELGTQDGQLRWRLAFEANRPLAAAMCFGDGGELGRAERRDEYRFDVVLDQAEVGYLLDGQPLYLLLRPSQGQAGDFTGLVRLGPRFVQPVGSQLIWLEPGFGLVDFDGQLRLRGRATAADKIEQLEVLSQLAAPLAVAREASGRWWFDFAPAELRLALSDPQARIELRGRDQAGQAYLLEAGLALVVEQLGLTTGDAAAVWPALD